MRVVGYGDREPMEITRPESQKGAQDPDTSLSSLQGSEQFSCQSPKLFSADRMGHGHCPLVRLHWEHHRLLSVTWVLLNPTTPRHMHKHTHGEWTQSPGPTATLVPVSSPPLATVFLCWEILCPVWLGRKWHHHSSGAAGGTDPAHPRQPHGQTQIPLPGVWHRR